MARTITVAPGPNLQPGEVAIWEVDEQHPDGEIFLAKAQPGEADKTIEVARTLAVNARLGDGRLVERERPSRAPEPPAPPAAPPARASSPPPSPPSPPAPPAAATQPNQPLITDEQRKALADAGFETAEQIRAASDEQLLDVPGIGPATLTRLREATRE